MKSSSASCVPTASAISFRQWPALTQKRPDDASISRSPRSFHRYMPSARTTIFGSSLKSRFGVNGIQYSSIEMRLRGERVLELCFGVAHRRLLGAVAVRNNADLESYTRAWRRSSARHIAS